ncbi:MAG TPA: restriction endonuclease subunit S [Flavobacterium sp.]
MSLGMQSNYKRLGKYIREVNDRNHALNDYPLLGVSIQKKVMPSIANIIGTDMSTYKILKRNQFAYGPVTSRNGDKISLALLATYDHALVTQAYTVFAIIDEKELLPEYLMMWFRRPEFDRYARFMSHGSAREIFSWTEMCDTLLPIPSIESQTEIVREYNVIQNRIALNNQLIKKLEEVAKTSYEKLFIAETDISNLPYGWKLGKIADLCSYSERRVSISQLDLNTYISTENMLQLRAGVSCSNSLPVFGNATLFESENVLISNIRPYLKKIWLSTFNGGCSNDVLCFVPAANIPILFLYQILEKDSFFEYMMAGSKGTKMPRGDKKWIMDYPVIIPSSKIVDEFSKSTKKLQTNIHLRQVENNKLAELKDLLHSKLATGRN